MATLEEIFVREFNQMMLQRRANTGFLSLYDVDVPDIFGEISKRDKVYVTGIQTEYYDKLNESEAMVWSHGKLSRRKYDYRGEYIKKDGQYVLEEVTTPQEGVAIISDIQIAVPNKFKDKICEYVDVIHRKTPQGMEVKYVYIVPRENCYKLNQTALVLSFTKLRKYYYGSSVALQNGYILYMYIIPYKATSNVEKNYRVLQTGTSLEDYEGLTQKLLGYWRSKGYLFDFEACQLYEGVKGRENMAYEIFPAIMETFERYNPDKSMATVEDVQDLWADELPDEEEQ